MFATDITLQQTCVEMELADHQVKLGKWKTNCPVWISSKLGHHRGGIQHLDWKATQASTEIDGVDHCDPRLVGSIPFCEAFNFYFSIFFIFFFKSH